MSLADSCILTNAIQSGKRSGRTKGLPDLLPFAQYLHPQVVYKHRAASERTSSADEGNAVGIADGILRRGRGLGGRGNAHPKDAGGGGGFGGRAAGAPPDADALPPRSGKAAMGEGAQTQRRQRTNVTNAKKSHKAAYVYEAWLAFRPIKHKPPYGFFSHIAPALRARGSVPKARAPQAPQT